MTPIQNKILAEIIEQKPTEGGLLLMSADLAKYSAKVLAVGPDVEYTKIGDVIRYNPNTATDYDHEGKNCVFLREDQDCVILC